MPAERPRPVTGSNPATSVVYRSIGTSRHSSRAPSGQVTLTRGGVVLRAEADEHARIVRRREAAIGARAPPP